MSLILNDTSLIPFNLLDGPVEDERDTARLDHYLAIIESNKKSCHFVPDDAMLALDMAGFVRGQLSRGHKKMPVSTARLALSLVQPCPKSPMQ